MKSKQLLPGIGAFIGILILILDGKTAMQGAYTGIDLCLKTVIPSLFPFFVLSALITHNLAGKALPFLHVLGKMCGIPQGAESILLCGFLGGYPAGAQSIAEAYQAKLLKRSDAQRMLAFCSNAGPAFLFGMIAPLFPSPGFAWLLWGIHMISALLVGSIFPGKSTTSSAFQGKARISLTDALQSSLHIMACVCGWVVLFRVLIAFLSRWFLWMLPVELQVLATGLLELSNGCCELSRVTDLTHRFILCSAMLAIGGLCVTMQTISVISGLSVKTYLQGKFLQLLFSLILCSGLLWQHWLLSLASLITVMLLFAKNKNSGSIQTSVGV